MTKQQRGIDTGRFNSKEVQAMLSYCMTKLGLPLQRVDSPDVEGVKGSSFELTFTTGYEDGIWVISKHWIEPDLVAIAKVDHLLPPAIYAAAMQSE